MLSDLPTELHLLILEHDEEKKCLKEENERLKTRLKMTQRALLATVDLVPDSLLSPAAALWICKFKVCDEEASTGPSGS